MDDKLKETLTLYNLKSPKADMLRHNENATYKVVDGGKDYVLRIHQPTEGFSLGMLHTNFVKYDLIHNEIQIINDLADSADILLQRPMLNCEGDTVSVLSCGTPATLLEWIQGETLEQANMTSELFFTIGETVAKMHRHWSVCKQKYARFSYDQSLLPCVSEAIRDAATCSIITKQQEQTIHEAIAEIRRRFDELDQTGLTKHIVHADLYKQNIVQNKGIVTPIDFSLCGYSHFYLDIAAILSHSEDDNDRQSLLAGYKSIRNLEINPYFIEPYYVLETLLFYAHHYKRAHEWDWWSETVESECEEEFKPLAAKERFLKNP